MKCMHKFQIFPNRLTHWGRVTHICVSKLTIIGSDNDLSPGRHQAITETNVGILLIWTLWTNFSEILVEVLTSSFKKMSLKVSSAKRRPFCLDLNVLKQKYALTSICTVSPMNHIEIRSDPFLYRLSLFHKTCSTPSFVLNTEQLSMA